MTRMMKREGRAKHGLPAPLSSTRSVPSSCTRCQRTCRGNTKTTGSVTALNRIFYSIARITSITHLTTSYDQLKSQGRNSHTSIILPRVSTILSWFSLFFFSTLCKQAYIPFVLDLTWKSRWILEYRVSSKNSMYFFPLYRNVCSRHWSNFNGKSRIQERPSWGHREWRKKCNCQFVTIDRPAERN